MYKNLCLYNQPLQKLDPSLLINKSIADFAVSIDVAKSFELLRRLVLTYFSTSPRR